MGKYDSLENAQPRPQGFSLTKSVGWEKVRVRVRVSRPTHFLREKPWGRSWKMPPREAKCLVAS